MTGCCQPWHCLFDHRLCWFVRLPTQKFGHSKPFHALYLKPAMAMLAVGGRMYYFSPHENKWRHFTTKPPLWHFRKCIRYALLCQRFAYEGRLTTCVEKKFHVLVARCVFDTYFFLQECEIPGKSVVHPPIREQPTLFPGDKHFHGRKEEIWRSLPP